MNNIDQLQTCLAALEAERKQREAAIEAAAQHKIELEEQRKHLTSSILHLYKVRM